MTPFSVFEFPLSMRVIKSLSYLKAEVEVIYLKGPTLASNSSKSSLAIL
jgi:hypothetical protein